MVVVVKRAERSQHSGGDEAAIAEVVVLIFGLGRPVLGEHVFDARADGVAVAMTVVEREGDRNAAKGYCLVVVGIGVAAFDVDQARAPGVADAAGDGSDRTLVIPVDKAAGEGRVELVVTEPRILAFDAYQPVWRELPVAAGLH